MQLFSLSLSSGPNITPQARPLGRRLQEIVLHWFFGSWSPMGHASNSNGRSQDSDRMDNGRSGLFSHRRLGSGIRSDKYVVDLRTIQVAGETTTGPDDFLIRMQNAPGIDNRDGGVAGKLSSTF